jgi:hypothetical protein
MPPVTRRRLEAAAKGAAVLAEIAVPLPAQLAILDPAGEPDVGKRQILKPVAELDGGTIEGRGRHVLRLRRRREDRGPQGGPARRFWPCVAEKAQAA